MIAPSVPENEPARLASLRRLELLDSAPEERFDRITRLAQRLFGVPMALVSLVDADRQWFKSKQGLDADETPRRDSFCGHAILTDEVMEVQDAAVDERFSDNPLVVGQPNIRFYAGCPILSPDGAIIGTLCLLDREPRALGSEEVLSLKDLAAMVEQEIAMTRLAVDDELTGLANRRGFAIVANQALAACGRQEADAMLVSADVNGLKTVNDRYGHAVGDQLLKQAAAAMSVAFRRSDVLARLGGDEFAAFLSHDQGDDAAARLNEAVADTNRRLVGAPFTLSMAVGSVRFDHTNPQSLDEMLHTADVLMYAHKQAMGSSSRARVAIDQ